MITDERPRQSLPSRRLCGSPTPSLTQLNSIRIGQIAAYTGTFDQVEKLLETLGIQVVVDPNPKKLQSPITFINCSRNYNPDFIEQMGEYVKTGHWLVTSDWALHYVIEKAFSGMAR